MSYIPLRSLENLKKYSYKGVDRSLLSRYVLNPYWNWLVTLWPLSVAPNTITLTGLAIVFINFLTMLYYDPNYLTEKQGATGPPHWVYFTWALGLFLYQSLDAIDGKQARRTGMAGPLGQLFDHGCDALNITLGVLLVSNALGMGRSWWTVAAQVATLANFYLTTWEEYYTGQLFLGYFSGPVEGIIMVVIIFIISGLYGPSFWEQDLRKITHLDHIPFIPTNLRLNESFMVLAGVLLAFNIIHSYLNVWQATRAQKQKKSTLKPLLHLLPFLFSTLLQIAWLSSHPQYNNNNNNNSYIIQSAAFVPFLCAWGLQFAHQVGRMILAHVTKTAFPVWDWIWVLSILGALDANMPLLLGRSPIIQTSSKNTAILVWITLVISFIVYGRFVTLVIRDITNYLGIACFRVGKKDKKGDGNNSAQSESESNANKQL